MGNKVSVLSRYKRALRINVADMSYRYEESKIQVWERTCWIIVKEEAYVKVKKSINTVYSFHVEETKSFE